MSWGRMNGMSISGSSCKSEHLAGIVALYEINFTEGIDLPPFGKGVDVFGDGSLWAISSSGHSKGHVMYFINGIEDSVPFYW